MPLGKYYCDYCDKQFQDTPFARKRHIQGLQHQRAKALWYDSLRDSNQPYQDSFGIGVCNRFVRTEAKGISLPNFLPRYAFMVLLQRKIKAISAIPVSFVNRVWEYIETLVISVLMHHSENYPQLKSSTRRATQNLMAKMKGYSSTRVMEIVEMEVVTDYTCDPEYMALWSKLTTQHNVLKGIVNDYSQPTTMYIDGLGRSEVEHSRNYQGIRDEAFDMEMTMTAYRKVVLKRLDDKHVYAVAVDSTGLGE